MTDQPGPHHAGAEDVPSEPDVELQFDEAEYDAPPPSTVTCTFCKQAIPDSYYEINSKILCDRCRRAVLQAMKGGSGTRRFLRALVFGAAAAALGCALYYAILRTTHYELGLISILVGWMVGAAVRKGSDHRGGWFYQALAIFLTYSAIAGTRVPFILEALDKQHAQDQAGANPGAPGGPAVAPQAAQPEAAPAPAKKPPLQDLQPRRRVARPMPNAVRIVLIVVLAYLSPFLGGINFIGLLIIFFALQQAWFINRRPKVVVSGPYAIGEKPAAEAEPVNEGPPHA